MLSGKTWTCSIMSNNSEERNNSKDSSIKDNSQKTVYKLTPKNKNNLPQPSYPVSQANYKDNGLQIHPFVIIGIFVTSLGLGFLLGPSTGPTSSPPFQTWSLIIIGIIIAIIGGIQMIWVHLKKQKSENKEK